MDRVQISENIAAAGWQAIGGVIVVQAALWQINVSGLGPQFSFVCL